MIKDKIFQGDLVRAEGTSTSNAFIAQVQGTDTREHFWNRLVTLASYLGATDNLSMSLQTAPPIVIRESPT